MEKHMPPIYYDTETCGFHGPVVLIQWAEGDGAIHLHEVWTTPIQETLDLIEMMMNHPDGLVGFNLSFDHFHLCQLYTTLLLLPDKQAYPEDLIELYAQMEPEARFGPCLKPVKAHDLMLHARKGPYQSMMNRGEIRIRRVPSPLAWVLAEELEKRIPISDIYFAKRKNKRAPKWTVYDIEDSDGDIEPDFKDIVLRFQPSSALKVLAIDALKLSPDETLLFADIEIDKAFQPQELGYAPFAMAIGHPGAWNGAWPQVIRQHIRHWGYSKLARQYAEKDVEYTRGLYKHFGEPELGDDDSTLACMVGAVRWKGFAIDTDGIRKLKVDALIRKGKYPTAPEPARRYIMEVMDQTELLGMAAGVKQKASQDLSVSTKKVLLEEIAKWDAQPCPRCDGAGYVEDDNPLMFGDLYDPNDFDQKVLCDYCKGKKTQPHPASSRAAEVLGARKAGKELELYDKLLTAGRLHADFVVIGTLSSRMAGAGGLNAQGIKNEKFVREKFPLADLGLILCGGDFAGFEVVLAIAVYKDIGLMADVQRKRPCHKCTKGQFNLPCPQCEGTGVTEVGLCERCFEMRPIGGNKETERQLGCDDCKDTGITGTKIHALFGLNVYPDMTYEQILNNKQKYTRCKSAVFAMLYGGEAFTLKSRLGVDLEIAEKAYILFGKRYPGVAKARQKVIEMFSALSQPRGIGSVIEWKDPAPYIESMFGFRRYFDLENRIIQALYVLAQDPPAAWKNIKIKVWRRDREQTAMGASQSALYGAAFALQASNIRAAANHVIQSSGAQITKYVQRKIWDIQPSGANRWIVQPMNIHDEIMCVTEPGYETRLHDVVFDAVESFREKVPLIEMEWVTGLKTWADK